jgi:RNA polymerase sigma-70 factor (sigma-E family)
MTTAGNDTASADEDELLARLYQRVTGWQAAQYAASYDARAGLTRFSAWLRESASAGAVATAIRVGADTIPVRFRPMPAAQDWSTGHPVTELYARHYQALVRMASLLVRDIPTAEEVVQDAFVALAEGWLRLRDADKALAYLRQAVMNRSRSVLRHRAVADGNQRAVPPDLPSAEHEAFIQLERSAVVTALAGLPDRQREAIVLRYYAGLSEAEIADTMGISRGAVKSHTARGIAALRAVL